MYVFIIYTMDVQKAEGVREQCNGRSFYLTLATI